jgi:hypothetical protein
MKRETNSTNKGWRRNEKERDGKRQQHLRFPISHPLFNAPLDLTRTSHHHRRAKPHEWRKHLCAFVCVCECVCVCVCVCVCARTEASGGPEREEGHLWGCGVLCFCVFMCFYVGTWCVFRCVYVCLCVFRARRGAFVRLRDPVCVCVCVCVPAQCRSLHSPLCSSRQAWTHYVCVCVSVRVCVCV